MNIGRNSEAALAFYRGSTEDQKQAAQRFFLAMDADNSDNISIDEFTTFLTLAGFQSENFRWLFRELDKDRDGTLDFQELLTFFYILSRDEYRDQLKSRASTDVSQTQEGTVARRGRTDWNEVSNLLNALQIAFNVGQTIVQSSCSIL
ncbi:hypothetical protein NL676_021436 [Syzygium grande]|nr:hypothetical protein NL676_021436 [Syzygium grande]